MFIALSIVLERLQYEGVVDVFQTVRTLRAQRPAMVQTEDQYQVGNELLVIYGENTFFVFLDSILINVFKPFPSSVTGLHSNTSRPSTTSVTPATTARRTALEAHSLAESQGLNDKRPLLSRSESELILSMGEDRPIKGLPFQQHKMKRPRTEKEKRGGKMSLEL